MYLHEVKLATFSRGGFIGSEGRVAKRERSPVGASELEPVAAP
jgi:hypothetical protein